MAKKVLIIGSGLGALATALRLTSKGFQVEIVEKYSQPGGRLNLLEKDGFTFDLGPSFFSMSYEFRELFDSCNIKMPFEIDELNPVYAVNFSHRKKPFYIYKNIEKLSGEFAEIESNFSKKFNNYIGQAKNIFHDTEDIVIRRNFKSKTDYLLNLTKVPLRHSPKMFRSMWTELDRTFDSNEAKVIFSLVAFFLGDTPFKTPAVYSLLNYTELEHDGYWNVKGGMYEIVRSLREILEKRNVKFHFNTEIVSADTKDGKLVSFTDANRKKWEADIFVCNSDAASFRGKVLGRQQFSEQKLDKMKWTLAPFTIYLGVKGKIPGLIHHNYFLGSNFKEYSEKIFTSAKSPEKPYYYVNVSSKSNPACAPDGCENLFILCPVPDLRYKSDWSDSGDLADSIIADLSSRCGYDISENIISKTVLTPIDWEQKFNLYRGSGLGLAHGLSQVGGFRPANKDEDHSNLYYVGASTIPGTGLPMVVISSRLATERIINEHTTL